MDFIWNKITEWLKEILVGGIMSNMTKLFDQVNRQVGDIAAQVGTTPAAWNSGVFNMIRTLSADVILPIAGVILAIVMTMELGELFGMWFQSLFVGVTMSVLTIIIFVVIYGRMVEIYLVTSIAPLPMATMLNREWGSMGQNYLRSLFALGFQAFLIIVCVAIYAVLVKTISLDVTGDVNAAIWTCIGYTVLLCFTLFKSGSVAKGIFGAH